MPGVDPALLASLGQAAHAAANPVSAPGPGAPATPPPPAEPVALHECCQAAGEAVDAAREALEQLQQEVELAQDVDPKAESLVAKIAAGIQQIDDEMEQVEQILAGQRQEHEAEVAGTAPGAKPGGDKPAAAPPAH